MTMPSRDGRPTPPEGPSFYAYGLAIAVAFFIAVAALLLVWGQVAHKPSPPPAAAPAASGTHAQG
jgi:hypothetical protein